VELQGRVKDLERAGLGLAVITYDPPAVLAEFSARRNITFPLLSDAGSATIRRYGILNTTVPETNRLHGYPFPGTFTLDRKGVVTGRLFEQAFQERHTVASTLVRLGGSLDLPATKTNAAHLEVVSYPTDAVAAPGTRFAVVLDVRPGPGIHVYAPGVKGYRPIRIRLDPQPGLVVGEASFPEPEIYHFKPLDEHVPVYQRPFRVIQDLMIDPSRAAAPALKGVARMTISATLEYQACDDKLCFLPQSVPLSWTVALRPLDTERGKTP
jgi:hypothetical protein